MDIGKAIAHLRAKHGLSQQELADRLFISRDLVAKWESGRRRPDYPMIEKIADVFSVSPDEIVDKNDITFEELSECLPDGIEVSGNELISLLNSFLKVLSSRDADMFMMRYYHLRPTAEIAKAFGIRENHVRSRLSEVRTKLKRFIKEELK